MSSPPDSTAVAPIAGSGSAKWVAAGILLSRIAGLIRERVFAHYFSTTLYADAFRAALRMPNALQNLLGEGTLSASFIPIYAHLLEQKREEEAGRFAGAIFSLLLAVAGALALFGILLAPILVDIFYAGFDEPRRDLAVACARIIFPMTGILVLSAWALGILNSHRRFFLSYVAPVFWNAAMIATLIFFGGRLDMADLTLALAWGALVGGALQFLVQLPWVWRLNRGVHARWDVRAPVVRQALANAAPAIMGRGVVQVSGYVDMFIASFMAGAVAVIGYAQTLYILPISLFGMSVAAAELPELSRQRGAAAEQLRDRVTRALRRMALLVVPSTVGYIILGDIIVAALYQTGDFGRAETVLVALTLAAYAIGLLAATSTRLFSSAFFALQDTRTPARIAILRVSVAAAVGGTAVLVLRMAAPEFIRFGPIALGLAAGIGAWLEWWLLRRKLQGRLGRLRAGGFIIGRLLAAAAVAAGVVRLLLPVLPQSRPIITALIALPVFGVLYFVLARLFGVEEAGPAQLLRALRR